MPAPGELCKVCRGGCCEDVALGLEGLPDRQLAFLDFRGSCLTIQHPHTGEDVRVIYIPVRCKHLARDGRCDAYGDRPEICRRFEEGGPACRSVMRRLRRVVVPTFRAPHSWRRDYPNDVVRVAPGFRCACGGRVLLKARVLGQTPVVCEDCDGAFCDADLKRAVPLDEYLEAKKVLDPLPAPAVGSDPEVNR